MSLYPAFNLWWQPFLFFQTWGVRKLTVVDSGSVVMSDLVKQSLYIDKDCGVPRVSAIAPHLKERCPAVVRTVFSLKHMLMNFYCI